MSFQDFGKNKRVGATPPSSGNGIRGSTPPRSALGAYSSSSGATGGTGGRGGASAGGGGLAQISESLLQYQRNVGILENIVKQVQQLKHATGSMSSMALKELQMQYHVQIDVVHQLEQKVRRQMQTQQQQQNSHQIIKLSRDFETVRSRVQSVQKQVDSMKSLFTMTSNDTNSNNMMYNQDDENNSEYAQQQQRLQLQLQEDRLAEEIMREREEEISKINRGMHQVNEIYKDLAHIVGTQQEQIDTIETQMEESRANAESGLQQVEKANEKYGQTNCIIS